MPSKNKSRGNRAERIIAQTLSRILEIPFVRTPNSGAWGRAKTKGDVVCIAEGYEFPFSIESKKTKQMKLELLLRDPIWSDFQDWWKQTSRGALEDEKFPLLIISHNQTQPLVISHFAMIDDIVRPIENFFLLRRGRQKFGIATLEDFAHAFKDHVPQSIKDKYAEELEKYTGKKRK